MLWEKIITINKCKEDKKFSDGKWKEKTIVGSYNVFW
jgi:hypothetical protein